ncbi:MAG: tetratricopeptide repeat protein, partial [Bacteroidota bacterium]|nr:tetratricopeptide repeat protein [Bacteroidota bacterium]
DDSYMLLKSLKQFYPNNIEVLYNLGKIYAITDRIQTAKNYFENAFDLIRVNDSYNDLLSDIAYEFLQIGQNLQAIHVMKRIVEIKPEDESTMMELGIAFHESGLIDEAIIYFTEIIDSNAYSHIAWFNLGTLHNVKEDWKEALFAFDMCLVINEKFTAAHYGKANSYIQEKEYQNAIDTFNESFNFDHPNSYAYCCLGECYEKIGDFKKALIFYEKSLEIDDSQSDAWLGIGVVRDLNNQTLDALKFIEKAINLDPENPEYWYIFAEFLSKLGKITEAEDAFKKVVELDPGNIDAWIDYSNFLFENTSKTRAIKEVERAIITNKGDQDLKLRLIAMQIASGKIADAKSKLIDFQKNENSSIQKLFEIYPEIKNIPEIIDVIKKEK